MGSRRAVLGVGPGDLLPGVASLLALAIWGWTPGSALAQELDWPESPEERAAREAQETQEGERGLEIGLSADLAFVAGLDPETQGIGVGQGARARVHLRPHPAFSIGVGGQATGLYGGDAIAWVGTLAGARLHWAELFGLDFDGWLEVNHVWGFSSTLSSHGVDVSLGLTFPFFDAAYAGPMAYLTWLHDPDGTPVWMVGVGLSIAGWPMRGDEGAPPGPSEPPVRRYVAPRSLREAPPPPRSQGRAWILPTFEVVGMHALDDAHRDDVGFGAGASAGVEFPFLPWLGVHVGASALVLSAQVGRPAAWVGAQTGARLHWTTAAGLPHDAWIDLHHVYGVSGEIATHGADIGVGAAFDVAAFLRVGPVVRFTLLTDPAGDPAMLLSIGVTISVRQPEPGPGNVDGDAVLDRDDTCGEIAEGDVEDPDNPGCPLLDRDGDGVRDDIDLCDTEPAGDYPDPERRGCPRPDRDGDGTIDIHDFCPDQPNDDDDPLRDGCEDEQRQRDVPGLWTE